jgi:hypothetical protein
MKAFGSSDHRPQNVLDVSPNRRSDDCDDRNPIKEKSNGAGLRHSARLTKLIVQVVSLNKGSAAQAAAPLPSLLA